MPQTYIDAILGGALIGLAASMLLLFQGRIAGISGVLGGIISPQHQDKFWRLSFLLGLLIGAYLVLTHLPMAIAPPDDRSTLQIVIAGLLVGFGTRLGNGCTSGHGVCGLSRRSIRSLVSTMVFMVFGFCAATCIAWFMDGAA